MKYFIRDIGFAADTLIIDPDYWLITANNTSEKLEEKMQNKIDIFPSPFLNEFYINLRNFSSTNVRLGIYDSKGTLMAKKLFCDQQLFII